MSLLLLAAAIGVSFYFGYKKGKESKSKRICPHCGNIITEEEDLESEIDKILDD